jgi:hypothetical protein
VVMEKVIEIKTVIKNLNILAIVVRKFHFEFTRPREADIPAGLGDASNVVGLIEGQRGMPVCFIVRKGKWYTLIPHNCNGNDDILELVIKKIKHEYVRTEILKTALQRGWKRVKQRRDGKMCQIILAV